MARSILGRKERAVVVKRLRAPCDTGCIFTAWHCFVRSALAERSVQSINFAFSVDFMNRSTKAERKRQSIWGQRNLSSYNAYKQGKLVKLPFLGSQYINLND